MRSQIPIWLVLAASPAVAQEREPPPGSEKQEKPTPDPPAVSDEEIEETIAAWASYLLKAQGLSWGVLDRSFVWTN